MSTIDIFLTMFKHPEMLELVVESFNCTRKPREYRLWGIFEHGFDPALEPIFDRVREVETKKVFRETLHGINWNTPRSWIEVGAATKGEYVLQFQSDTYLAKDFLEFVDYCMTNFDVGYTFGYGYKHNLPRDDSRVKKDCRLGWYGHIGCAVRTKVVNELYPKYFVSGYQKDPQAYGKQQFPDMKYGGSDHYANRFLVHHKISGVRPSSSRVTNMGITGEHIKLTNGDEGVWTKMSREEKLDTLRVITKNGKVKLSTNVDFGNIPRVLGDYQWEKLNVI